MSKSMLDYNFIGDILTELFGKSENRDFFIHQMMCVYKIKRSEQYGYGVTNKGVSLKFAEVHPSVNRHGIAV